MGTVGFFPWHREEPIAEQLKIVETIGQIRSGDQTARETLIGSYTPYITRIAARVCGRFISPVNDEELSIGLLAFNEAIDAFDPEQGTRFLSFAQTVIRRRLIDYLRRQKKYQAETSLDMYREAAEGPNTAEPPGLVRRAAEEFAAQDAGRSLQEEILQYREELAGFNISLQELTAVSPRHRDARQRAIEVARLISRSPEMSTHLRSRKELPLKELAETVGLSRKTLERQRKYIIAIALVFLGDYVYLADYLRG